MTDTINELAKDLILSKMTADAKTEVDFIALGYVKAYFDAPEIKTLNEYNHGKVRCEGLLSELSLEDLSSPAGIQAMGFVARVQEYENTHGSTTPLNIIGSMLTKQTTH